MVYLINDYIYITTFFLDVILIILFHTYSNFIDIEGILYIYKFSRKNNILYIFL